MNEPVPAPEKLPPVSRRAARAAAKGAAAPQEFTLLAGFFQPLPAWVWAIFGALAVWAIFTPDRWLTLFSVCLPPVLATLLWFRGEPPALLFACLLQWLQAAVAILYANARGNPVQTLFPSPDFNLATGLSLAGVLVLAVGMRLALGARSPATTREFERQVQMLSPRITFTIYLIGFGVFLVLGKVSQMVPALRQPLTALSTFRWVLAFLLTTTVIRHRKGYGLVVLMVLVEMGMGLLGYFSGFRNVFSLLIVALATAKFLFQGWRLVQVSVVTAALLVLCVVWTVVKGDYRDYLNQGSGLQVIQVSVPQQVAKLEELVRNVDRPSFERGMDQLIMRISYVNFFALSIAHVPANVPHEHGNLWLGAVKHVLMPRLFFPNKPAIHDSERTEYYTGVKVAGADEGTSIGIGYMGESYIDFGATGMFFPIFLLGLFYGLIYRYFISQPGLAAIGAAAATSILIFGAYNIETSNIKLFGGNLTNFMGMALLIKFFGLPLWRFLISTPALVRDRQRAHRRRPRRLARMDEPGAQP